MKKWINPFSKEFWTNYWGLVTGHKAITALVAVLLLIAGAITWTNFRINRRTRVAREEKQYRLQHETRITALEGRVTTVEQAVTDPADGILAKLREINTNHGELVGRVTTVEVRVDRLETKIDKSTEKLLHAIEALGGTVESASPADEEPTAAAEPVERPGAATKPAAPVKPAAVERPRGDDHAAARPVTPEEPSAGPAMASTATKRGAANADEYLARARRIHADAEKLLEGALEGRDLTPEQRSRVEEHQRCYRPSPEAVAYERYYGRTDICRPGR